MRVFRAELRVIAQGTNPTPLDWAIDNLISEGNQAVVELRNEGRFPNGDDYPMVYCFVLRVRDGRIVSVREYADTRFGFEVQKWLLDGDSDVQDEMRKMLATVESGGGSWPAYS